MNDVPQAISSESEDRIEDFETRLAEGGELSLRDFLPEAGDDEYLVVLQELIRIHLEHQLGSGKAADLKDYFKEFPELRDDPTIVQALAYEEFRLRKQAGLPVDTEELRSRFGSQIEGWSSLAGISSGAGSSGVDEQFEPPTLKAGDTLLDFAIVGQLGRGAFARVYLARQKSLADRLVVLKLSSARLREARRLARLQHTNIVPVYSAANVGQMSVLCMPWFGATTLRHVIDGLSGKSKSVASGIEMLSTVTAFDSRTLKSFELRPADVTGEATATESLATVDRAPQCILAGLNHEEACLWVASRIAEGLSQAHQRGILHRDLKPANILLTEDGQPMILDFNLASERNSPDAGEMIVGGTLPYMSPEQLDAVETLKPIDARSDLFSLGVMLFELLCGRLPFELITTQTRRMIEERRTKQISFQTSGRLITPGTISILQKCLKPEPADRYQSAEELILDINRHLSALPLVHALNVSRVERVQKFAKRHPSLTSVTAISTAAIMTIAAVGALWLSAQNRVKIHEAQEAYSSFMVEVPRVRSMALATVLGDVGEDAAEQELSRLLDSLKSADDGSGRQELQTARLSKSDQKTLASVVVELQTLQALVRNSTPADEQAAPDDRAEANKQSESTRGKDQGSQAVQPYFVALNQLMRGEFHSAESSLREIVGKDPSNFSAAFLYGLAQRGCLRPESAEDHFSACIALRPDLAQSWYQRGVCRLAMKDFAGAESDFSAALEVDARYTAALFSRALASRERPDGIQSAIHDLTSAIEAGFDETRIYFVRADLYEQLGNAELAKQDRETGLRLPPTDVRSWVARALKKLPDDPAAALMDLESGALLEPDSHDVLRNKAMLLSEHLGREAEAIQVLDRAIEIYPYDAFLWSGRAVLHARHGSAESAMSDISKARELSEEPMVTYQAACVYAILSKSLPDQRLEALKLLEEAFRLRTQIARIAWTDKDMDAIRDDMEFKRLLAASEILNPK
ncbi:MAG: protein kinase [Planctomyces sp.]|nr:protein kinase [Planctomyces sp.]